MRTSHQQFEHMITYMEQHGDLSKSCTNLRDRIVALKHWNDLTSLMNSDATGNTKNIEKWKKVWSDFKNNTKKKAVRLQRAASTAGRKVVHTKLTDLEKRVLNLIGAQSTTDLAINDAGFSQDVIILQGLCGPSTAPFPIPVTENMQLELRIEQGNQDTHSTQLIPHHIQLVDGKCEGGEFSQSSSSSPVVHSVANSKVQPSQSGCTPQENGPTKLWRSPLRLPRQRSIRPILADEAARVSPARLWRSPLRIPRQRSIRQTLADDTARRSHARLWRSPLKLPRQRSVSPTPSDEVAQRCAKSKKQWKKFKIQQHEDYMEMRRDQNRIRELEVQTQREWQGVALRVVDLLDRLVTRYCRD